jgi:rare lipoprotein A
MVLAAVAFAIAGCSETQLVMHTAKRMSQDEDAAKSRYKIGKPYRIGGVWYYPAVDYKYRQTGIASWYGPKFHGKPTANGERFDMNEVSAAHRTLPLPSMVRVVNLNNGRAIRVRINDRGPFAHGRIIDLSRRAAQLLGFANSGTARVRVEILAEESRQLAALYASGAGGAQIATSDLAVAAKTSSPSVKAAPRVPVTSTSLPPPGGAPTAAAKPRAATTAPPRRAPPAPIAVTPAQGASIQRLPVQPTQIYIQAGAFAQFENANRLRARISVLGQTRVTAVGLGGQQLFRVRLGPVASVGRADSLLARLIGAGYSSARIVVDD